MSLGIVTGFVAGPVGTGVLACVVAGVVGGVVVDAGVVATVGISVVVLHNLFWPAESARAWQQADRQKITH